MNFNSALLVILFILLVIEPGLGNWLFDEANKSWYRYHLIWATMIGFVFINTRRHKKS